ncbi:hypothetical protein [Phenylobacterium sp.]|uniref:hypothetical protein n=1 Tax=Phenylobacterium sp. TaxID=1871053 RepID=UPI0025F14B99|nr:hypothetical protein [Phenylobacterium sp.]MCA6343507.1 hypothetical protein [Phenylobacterium sp.]
MNVQVNPADVWARAIIAAARVFGDDPVEAVVAAPATGRAGKRQTLPAACLGIAKVSGLGVGRVAPVLGLQPNAARAIKGRGGADFRRAVQSAERAAQYAVWRPEAAESVAGSASGDLDLAGLRTAAMDPDVIVRAVEALAPPPVAAVQDKITGVRATAVILDDMSEATESVAGSASGDLELVDGVWTSPYIARPHAPVAGPLSLANGYAFAPPFRPGPPPPTLSIDGRILARLAVAPGSPRVLASILDIKESFVALHLRNLAREGLVIAADLAPGQSDRDQAWRVA